MCELYMRVCRDCRRTNKICVRMYVMYICIHNNRNVYMHIWGHHVHLIHMDQCVTSTTEKLSKHSNPLIQSYAADKSTLYTRHSNSAISQTAGEQHNVHSENDSRMYCLIVLTTDYCWCSWTFRIAAPYKYHVD